MDSLTITFVIQAGLAPWDEPAPVVPDRPRWRQLTWPWAEDHDPDAPAPL